MNDEEFVSFKCMKLKYRRDGISISAVLQNWFPQEIRSTSLILGNFRKLRKVLLNDEQHIEI